MPNTADLSGPAVRQSRTETIGRPYVLFEDGRDNGRALLFDAPKEIIVARDAGEVARAFARMEAASRSGLHLAGYASYELGYALEPKLAARPSPESRTPLLLFGAFAAPRAVNQDLGADLPESRISLQPAWTSEEYAQRFQKCRDYIFA
ncbi:MAG TPA: aminodeoxychorismate synthase component I, partial [Methylocystis sp.]